MRVEVRQKDIAPYAAWIPHTNQQDPAPYRAEGVKQLAEVGADQTMLDDATIRHALYILERRIYGSNVFQTPESVKSYLKLKAANLEHEVFAVLFIDSQNRLLKFEEMFRGTVSQTSVYPREVVKEALKLNASAVIFSHNHPSGDPTPSRADEHLTQTLKAALALVDVRVIDHIITGGSNAVSMAEKGML